MCSAGRHPFRGKDAKGASGQSLRPSAPAARRDVLPHASNRSRNLRRPLPPWDTSISGAFLCAEILPRPTAAEINFAALPAL